MRILGIDHVSVTTADIARSLAFYHDLLGLVETGTGKNGRIVFFSAGARHHDVSCELARAEGAFGPDDIVAGIVDKLVRRHPHVFGDTTVTSSGEVLQNWERIKAKATTGSRSTASSCSSMADLKAAICQSRISNLTARAASSPASRCRRRLLILKSCAS